MLSGASNRRMPARRPPNSEAFLRSSMAPSPSQPPAQPASTNSSAFVDLYQLLQLKPLEDNAARIQAKLERLSATARASAAQPAGSAAADDSENRRLLKLVALGQKYLLDPSRKAEYDRQWRQQRPPASTPAWDLSALEPLLPAGDPLSPFDMAAHVRQTPPREGRTPEEDLATLLKLLGGHSLAAAPAAAQPIPAAGLAPPVASPANSPAPNLPPHATPAPPPAAPHIASPAAPLTAPRPQFVARTPSTKRRGKKRDSALILNLVALAAVVGVLVGTLYVLTGGGASDDSAAGDPVADAQPANPRQAAANAAPSPAGAAAPANSGAPPQPRRSGLPRPGENSGDDLVANSNPTNSNPASAVSDTGMPEAGMPEAGMPETGMPETGIPDAGTPGVAMSDTDMPGAGDSGATEAAAPGMATNAAALTAEQKAAWQAGLEEAKASMGQMQFDNAKQQLSALRDQAKTPRQRDQLRRMEQVEQLTREFHTAVVAAIGSLGPAEVIRVGSTTEAPFIEGSPTSITVRIQGRTRRFALPEMPVGLALGLANLKLDSAHPTSLAKKGAFIFVHPESKADNFKTGKRFLTEAAQAGAVPDDLPLIFDDSFELGEELPQEEPQ
jgi:hypothetical protein